MSDDFYIEEPPLRERQPSLQLTCAAIFVLTFLYFGLGNDWTTPLLDVDNFQLAEKDVEEQADEGKTIWRLAFLGIGIVGCALLVYPGGRKPSVGNLLSIAILAAYTWAFLSVTWSEYPFLTLRRVLGLTCVILGALGFAKHFPATHACLLAVTYATLVMAVSIGAELALGTFSPFDGAYRFSGTAHPNQTAIRMSVLCLCSVTLARHYWKWRLILIPICLCAFAVVFFTKSRTSLAALMFALGAVWALDATPKFKIVSTIAMVVLGFVVLASLFVLGVDGIESVSEMASMGRDTTEDDPSSFTGRIPLWEYAINDIMEQPFLGHGFNSYWSDAQLADAHYELEWALPDAHNAYLEIGLGLGIIGLLFTLLMVAIGTYFVANARNRESDNGLAGIFGVCAFGILNGCFESHMLQPFNFTPFLVGCAFLRLAFFPRPAYQQHIGEQIPYEEDDVVWDESAT